MVLRPKTAVWMRGPLSSRRRAACCSGLPWLLLLGCGLCGCGRTNPVNEISVAESGVEVTDAATIGPDDWNAWRGPTNNGIAVSSALPPTTWDDQTNIRWRSDIPGRGHGSPIVVGQAVVLATALEDVQQQQVICLDRSDGRERWTTQIHQGGFPSSRKVHKKGTNANGTLASDGTRLFIGMLNSEAIVATALDLDGAILWQQEIGKFESKFGYAPSPILYKSLVIFAADNYGGGYLAAVDAQSGQIAWRVARGNDSSYSSPIVASVGGRDQLLISGCHTVSSYDPATGEPLWSTAGTAEATCGTVVTSNDRIFASGGYPEQETICLSADGQKQWSNDTRVYEPSMLVAGECLVAVKDDGIAIGMSVESGEMLWKKRLGGNFSASPILVGENVYVSNLNGATFVFRAGEQYEQIGKNVLGDDCYASPAVSRGELFLRIGVGSGSARQEQVVCIGHPD